MKRAASLFLVLIVLTLSVSAADIKVIVNDQELVTDAPPIMRDGRVLVPLRPICEALGCEVVWDKNRQIATIYNEKTQVEVEIGSRSIVRQTLGLGFTPIILDVPPMIFQSRTMVPVRAIAECFDANVKWDGASSTVVITVLMPSEPSP